MSLEKRIETLKEACGGYWGEVPGHPVEDWQLEVANGEVRCGYWRWAHDRLQEAGQYEGSPPDGLPKPPVRTEFLRVGDLVFWSDPLHSVASGHYRIEEINAEGFKIHEEGTGDVRTVAGHELELVGKHEPVQPEDAS